jgi:glycosyltransferase involved in cell wall biosynthesis
VVKRIAIIPIFNEESTLARVLDDVSSYVDQLIVVNDGSRDRSLERIRRWKEERDGVILLHHTENLGMAQALKSGFLYAEKLRVEGVIQGDDILINLDADGQHPVEEIPAAAQVMLDKDLDILLVSRDFSVYPLYKVWGNRLLTALARIVSGFPYQDVESGFRFIRARCLPNILKYYTGWKYSCAQEVAIITALHRLKIRNDHPVKINYYRPGTTFLDGFAVLVMSIVAFLRVKMDLANTQSRMDKRLARVKVES